MIFNSFKAALPRTLPIFAGFWFLGLAYGVFATAHGFPFWYPGLMAIAIFGGSLEFVAVSMLCSPFAPLQTFIVSFLIQARHIFYGIAMLEKYKGLGWKKPYLIYAMCDETFAINCSSQLPEGCDRGWYYFFVSLLNQSYWVTGVIAGSLAGDFITFNTKGLGFVMTTMFAVIFTEQWRNERIHTHAYIGIVCSLFALVLFGKDSFMVPALVMMVAALTLFRKPITRQIAEASHD